MEWQPIETAPKDGTWILGMNNRGNPAVIIWDNDALDFRGERRAGWIHPFSDGTLSTFWNGANGSLPEYWMPIIWHPKATQPPQWDMRARFPPRTGCSTHE
jgi:hypothetical protein